MKNRFNEYALPYAHPKKKWWDRSKKKLLILLISSLMASILLFLHFQRNVKRVLLSISEATMRASTTIAVNDAVYYTLSDEMRYDVIPEVIYTDPEVASVGHSKEGAEKLGMTVKEVKLPMS